MNPHFLVQSGPLAGQRIELAPGLTTLGREAGNTIVIADQTVSRQHARVTVSGVATVEDAGSSGGTFVNDVRIGGPTMLKVGDVVRLGGTALSFVPGASVSPMGVTATMPSRSGRQREVGSAETVKPPAPVMPLGGQNNPGCMPDMSQIFKDIEGCLPWLLRALIVLVIVGVVVAIIGGIILCASAGVGALGGAAAGGAGASQGAGGGSSPPSDQPPPQENNPKRAAGGSIKIVSVRTAYLPREGYHAPVAVVLVTWQNVGADPVVEVFADITAYDKNGAMIGIQRGVRIYTGAAVPSNGTHSDNEQTEGEIVALDQGRAQDLDHAKVTPTEIRTEPTRPDADE